MPIEQGIIKNIPSIAFSEGTNTDIMLGRLAEQIVSSLHGKYYTIPPSKPKPV